MMGRLPFTTIIIIVFNYASHIHRCLRSLESIDYPRDKFEIVVVDGGSTDGTQEICRGFGLKPIVMQWKNRGQARNVGIKHAKGSVIAFVDADCQVLDDWLMTHVKDHNSDQVGAVAGSVIYPYKVEINRYAVATHFEDFAEFSENAPKRFMYHFPGGNVSFKREVFSRVGFFDEIDSYEDFLLSRRMTQMGFKILFDPAARVLHFGRQVNMSPHSFLRKQIELAEAHFRAQAFNKNIFGRLPMQPIFTIFFTPSIILARTVREIYKLKYTDTFQSSTNFLVVPHVIMGGLVWGFAYVRASKLT